MFKLFLEKMLFVPEVPFYLPSSVHTNSSIRIHPRHPDPPNSNFKFSKIHFFSLPAQAGRLGVHFCPPLNLAK